MLCERFEKTTIRKHLLPPAAWAPFPRTRDRAAWNALLTADLNRQRAAYMVGAAEILLNQPWPDLSAVRYADFVRDGNLRNIWEPSLTRVILRWELPAGGGLCGLTCEAV